MAPVLTNLNVYFAVAEDALAEVTRLDSEAKKPKPDGAPGFVIVYDPKHQSFKQSLICIAFSGMYLEALLGLLGNERLGKDLYKKLDRQTNYEEKLKLLGVADTDLLKRCSRFREARNDLIHEKAIDLNSLGSSEFRKAQEEANLAVSFIRDVRSYFEKSL